MNRGVLVSVVLVPLVIGFGFLVFAISTEWWVKLDYSRIKNVSIVADNGGGGGGGQRSGNYVVKQIRLEFPKFTSLYGECDEYRLIDILVPVPINSRGAGSMVAAAANGSKIQDLDVDQCMSLEECNQLNSNAVEVEEGNVGCFCCQVPKNKPNYDEDKKCCYPASKRCDGVQQCADKNDELENCPQRKVFFSTKWYDNKHDCLRHQYNLIDFARLILRLDQKPVLNGSLQASQDNQTLPSVVNDAKIADNDDKLEVEPAEAAQQLAPVAESEVETETVKTKKIPNCIFELYRMNNYSIRIFLFRVGSLVCFILCGIFTLLCFFSMIFVTCCHGLQEKNPASREDTENDLHYGTGGASEEDEDAHGHSAAKRTCCKCNCLLCPFVFFAKFAIMAFIMCALGLGIYMFSLCYSRYAYLVYDQEYIPEYITQAYQSNSWLFDIQQFGISFYAIVVAFFMYLLVLILSTCVSCRIQMSPAWRRRYADSYEVLQMHDMVINSKKIYNQNKNSEKEEAKRRKKLEKIAKKEKKQQQQGKQGKHGEDEETERLAANGVHHHDDAGSTPKTRILAIDEAYE